MPTHTNVKQLFAPLGDRLYFFESKKYKNESTRHINMEGESHYLSFRSMMEKIVKDSNLYDTNMVYEEAKNYLNRTKSALNNLEQINEEINRPDWDEEGLTVKKASDERKEFWNDRYKNELSNYIESLQLIIKTCEQHSESSNKNIGAKPVVQTVIELPENFKVSQLNKVFEPQLSVDAATLFLYYLKKTEVLPPYSDTSLGKLAEAFFVRNQKNITTSFSNIYEVKQNSRHLNDLKKVLQNLLKEIDKDIKDAF